MLGVILAWHLLLSQELLHALLPETSRLLPSASPILVPAYSRMVLHPPHQSLQNWERCASLWEILLCVVQLGPNPISGPYRPHLLHMCMWIKLIIHHPSNGSLWKKKGTSGSGSRQELSITDWYSSSVLAFCVRGGVFQCGGKASSNHSFWVLRSFLEMPKVPNKGGFLSLAAAAPQNFPESQTSRVTSPLLVSLLAVQISASGFKGEKLVPPFATTASSRQDRTIYILTPL